MTSNLEADEVQGNLRPELVDRLDDVVVFRTLELRDLEKIVDLHLRGLADRLGARDVALVLTDEARAYLAKESSRAGSGARFVARTIARHLTNPLSSAILRGEIRDGATADVGYDGKAITVRAA